MVRIVKTQTSFRWFCEHEKREKRHTNEKRETFITSKIRYEKLFQSELDKYIICVY